MADDRFKPLPLVGPQNLAGSYVGAGTRSSPGAARAPAPQRFPLANPQPNGGASGLGIRRAGMEGSGVLAGAVQRGTAPTQPRLPGATSSAILAPGSFRVDSETGAGSPTSPVANGQPTAGAPITVRPNGAGVPRQAGPAQVVRPDFSGVNNGNARSIAGRDLGYGRQIAGVQVFSDGSGSGGIPRTMTDRQIGNLANGGRVTEVPSSAFTRPAPGVALSMATGGQTPELGSIRRPDTSTVFPRQAVSPERAAQLSAFHDIADIASGNMQSALGRASRNLGMKMQYGTPTQRENAGVLTEMAGATINEGVTAAGQMANTRLQEQGATQRAGMASATDLAREQMAGQFGLEQSRIMRPPQQAQQIPMADGSLGLLGTDGIVRPATMADGSPARPMAAGPSNAQLRSRDASLNRVQRNVQTLLSQLPPSDTGVTPEQLRGVRVQALQAEGAQIAENAETGEMLYKLPGGEWEPV